MKRSSWIALDDTPRNHNNFLIYFLKNVASSYNIFQRNSYSRYNIL